MVKRRTVKKNRVKSRRASPKRTRARRVSRKRTRARRASSKRTRARRVSRKRTRPRNQFKIGLKAVESSEFLKSERLGVCEDAAREGAAKTDIDNCNKLAKELDPKETLYDSDINDTIEARMKNIVVRRQSYNLRDSQKYDDKIRKYMINQYMSHLETKENEKIAAAKRAVAIEAQRREDLGWWGRHAEDLKKKF